MNIIDTLSIEHGLFYHLFEWIRRSATANPVAARVNGSCLIVANALESHARLEEELLFSALEPRLGSVGAPAVAVHRDEHRRLEGIFFEAVKSPSATMGGVLEAIEYAKSHFRREEELLIPIARKLLSASHLERLGQCWAESRGVKGA